MANEFNWNSVKTENTKQFMNFEDVDGVLQCFPIFEEDAPFKVGTDKFDNDKYFFNVKNTEGVPHIFSTSSKLCMAELAKHIPLKDKALCITRTGTGFDTKYIVEEIGEMA